MAPMSDLSRPKQIGSEVSARKAPPLSLRPLTGRAGAPSGIAAAASASSSVLRHRAGQQKLDLPGDARLPGPRRQSQQSQPAAAAGGRAKERSLQRSRSRAAPKERRRRGRDTTDAAVVLENTAAPEERRRRGRDTTAAAVVLEDTAAPMDPASARMKRLRSAADVGPVDASERMARHTTIEPKVEAVKEEMKEEKEDMNEIIRIKKEEVAELKIPMYDDVQDAGMRALRREQARESALLKRRQEEDSLMKDLGGDGGIEEEEEDDESSYQSDSEDERRGHMLKPVFVTKAQRDTVREREAQEREEAAALEREEVRKSEKKAESKSLLVDTIKATEEAELAALTQDDRSDVELMDDDDEKNEAEEYELWKIRELKRIKRDKEERLERQQELEFIERRRMMTDAEREEDDRRMDASSNKREEAKQFNFLQKYYHRGGFFQDKAVTGEEPLYNRDYHEPTEEEKFDKQVLPKAMQLRRGQFGKKGQVKHTHLTDSDTTDFSAAWSQHTKSVQKYQERMAAAKSVHVFDRPDGRKHVDGP